MKRPAYHARAGYRLSEEHRDLASRRTLPFLHHGTHHSIEHLMIEAYIQGLRDATEVLS